MATPGNGLISDSPATVSLDHASANGYARSKLVCERIIIDAVSTRQANATIFRIGQIVPARASGEPLWNRNEAVPLMIRSALTTGVLPNIPSNGDACSWLPVDITAGAILDLTDLYCWNESPPGISVHQSPVDTTGTDPRSCPGKRNPQLIYNLLNPRLFSWQKDVLPCLRNLGLPFETTSYDNWLAKLRVSNPDAMQNPSIKLLGFWEEQRSLDRQSQLRFDTRAAERDSVFVRNAPDIVKDGYLEAFVAAWLKVWG